MKLLTYLSIILLTINCNFSYAQANYTFNSWGLYFGPQSDTAIILTDKAYYPNDSATVVLNWNNGYPTLPFAVPTEMYVGVDWGTTAIQWNGVFNHGNSPACVFSDTIKISASEIADNLDWTSNFPLRNLHFRIRGRYWIGPMCSQMPINNFEIYYSQMKPDFSIDSSDYCEGDTIQFHDLNTHPSVQRLWRFPGGIPAMSTDSNPSIYYPVAGYYGVTLIVSNPYGTDSIVSANRIHISEGGAVDAGTDLSICQGDSIQLNAAAMGTSFVWMSDSTISSPFSLNTFVHPFQTTNYILWSGGWQTCSFYDTVQVTVLPVVTPTIQLNGSLLTSSPAVSYQWFRNDTLIAGAILQTYQTTSNGNYSVETTDNNGCQSRSAAVSFSSTGISDALTQSHFLVNDYRDYLEINAITEPVSCVQLFAISGAEIFKIEAKENQTKVILPVDQLKNGIYIISISGQQGSKGRFKYIH